MALYMSIAQEVRNNFEMVMHQAIHHQWATITHYYERSSYTQQCVFVEGLVSQLDDFDGNVEHYHLAFRKAVDGLTTVLRRQLPAPLVAILDVFGKLNEPIPSMATVKSWMDVDENQAMLSKLVAWIVHSQLQDAVRAIATPLYLRGIEGKFEQIVGEVVERWRLRVPQAGGVPDAWGN